MSSDQTVDQAYQHSSDIDMTQEQDVRILDDLCYNVIDKAIIAVQHHEKDAMLLDFLVDGLLVFKQTHESIRIPCKDFLTVDGRVSDALSLVREQIEKLFAFELVLSNPAEYIPIWLKQTWEVEYRHYLQNNVELASIDRWSEVQPSQYAMLEKMKQSIGIPEEEKLIVEQTWKAHSSTKTKFPTPGIIRSKYRGDNLIKKTLAYWYHEYVRYCDFSHALAGKAFLTRAQKVLLKDKPEMIKVLLEKRLDPGLTVSWVSIASIGLTVYMHYNRVLDLLECLDELWYQLQQRTFFGRKLYTIRARQVLPLRMNMPS